MGYYLTEPMTEPAASRTAGGLPYSSWSTPLAAKNSIWAPVCNTILSTKYWDSDTKTLGYQLRDYGPGLGRWLSRDPIGEMGKRNNIYPFCGNSPLVNIDAVGLYECRSEGFAARDPWYGMIWAESESGNSPSCDASISHWGKAKWQGIEAICNSGYIGGNTHLTIEARSPCCRKFRVTCLFSYSATVGNSSPGTPNRPTGIVLTIQNILGEIHGWSKAATPGSKGIWQAQLVKAMARTKIINIDSAWQTLFASMPGITAGTRAGSNSGSWIGAEFDEVFAASCSLTDVGPCD